MSIEPTSVEPPEEQLQTLLFVDDEPNILSSLRRLFRTKGYRILTAEGGAAGLELLSQEHVDLVISDMRMPNMDGAKFLEQVRQHWPGTMRLLLTGYSDIQSILDAINRGEIYRYITKPWDDNDIVLIIKHALERQGLEKEKERLETLAQKQNEDLKLLNASLEKKVLERTADLNKEKESVLVVNEKLKLNFITSIKVFSSLIEMRGGNLAGHSRRVADLGRKIAQKLNLDGADVQSVFIAGLLLDIGKMGFSDELLSRPVTSMDSDELTVYRKHMIKAEQLLMPLADLNQTAKILRSQSERFDGGGFPDHLSGLAIPVGARILALASDYDNLQIGALMRHRLAPEDAKKTIVKNSGTRYDPAVVIAFREVLGDPDIEKAIGEISMSSGKLEAGMVLSRDLMSKDGQLLLSGEHIVDEKLIQQILDFEKKSEANLLIWVHHTRRQS